MARGAALRLCRLAGSGTLEAQQLALWLVGPLQHAAVVQDLLGSHPGSVRSLTTSPACQAGSYRPREHLAKPQPKDPIYNRANLELLRESNWGMEQRQRLVKEEDSRRALRYVDHVHSLIRQATSLDDLRAIQMKYGSSMEASCGLSAAAIAKVPKVMANKAGQVEVRKAERLLDRLVPCFKGKADEAGMRELAGVIWGLAKAQYQLNPELLDRLLGALTRDGFRGLAAASDAEVSMISIGAATLLKDHGEVWRGLGKVASERMQQQLHQHQGASSTSSRVSRVSSSSSSTGAEAGSSVEGDTSMSAGLPGGEEEVAIGADKALSSAAVEPAGEGLGPQEQQQQQAAAPWQQQQQHSPLPVVVAWAHARAGQQPDPAMATLLLEWLSVPGVRAGLSGVDVGNLWYSLASWKTKGLNAALLELQGAGEGGSSSSSSSGGSQLEPGEGATSASQAAASRGEGQLDEAAAEAEGGPSAGSQEGWDTTTSSSSSSSRRDPYEHLVAATVALKAELTPVKLRTTLWALGVLGYSQHQLLQGLGTQVQRFADTKTADTCLMSTAFFTAATLGAEDRGLLLPAVVTLGMDSGRFSPWELGQILNGSSRLEAGQQRVLQQGLEQLQQPPEVRSRRGKRKLSQPLEEAQAEQQQQEAAAATAEGQPPAWCAAVAQEVVARAPLFKPAELAIVVRSWASHKPAIGLHEGMFRAVAEQLEQRPETFTTKEAASISRAFVTLGYRSGLPALESVKAALEQAPGDRAKAFDELQADIQRLQQE